MTPIERLSTDLHNYYHQVFALKQRNEKDDTTLLLLRRRDRIQALINQLAKTPDALDLPSDLWLQLAEADACLESWLTGLSDVKRIARWRKSIQPPADHWWWFLESKKHQPLLGWLFLGLTLAFIAVSLAFAKDIATRFFTGAPGIWSSIGAVVPVVVALFAAGGSLTKLGQQIVNAYLQQRVPYPRFWPLIKCLLALALLFGFFIGHWRGLPWAARRYHAVGVRQYYQEGQLAKAQANFQRSLQLDPDFPEANHDLALTYEDLRDFDKAKAEYVKAIQGGDLRSANNLARLLIKDEDYDSAAALLNTALANPQLDSSDIELKYGLLKNRGWAWLEQARLTEAEGELVKAVALEDDIEGTRPDAHCLLARIYQSEKDIDEARAKWERCLRNVSRPEDDVWAGMATKALAELDEESSDVSSAP